MLKEKVQYINNEISINVVQSKIESIRKKNISKTGMRVIENGKIGVAGALGKFDAEKLHSQAEKGLANEIDYPVELASNLQKSYTLENSLPQGDAFIKEAEELLAILIDRYPDFIFSNKINLSELTASLKNDSNTDLFYNGLTLVISLIFKEKTSSNIMDGYIALHGNKYDRESFLDYVDIIYKGYKNPTDTFESGTYPVVFSDAGVYMKFFMDLNGELFASGSSIFSGKLNQKLFNDDFTLIQSTDPKITLSPFFDHEGSINPDYTYTFVENGVLKAPYTDKRTAKAFNLEHTGSASGDYDTIPSISLQDLRATLTHDSLQGITKEPCVWVYISSGGDFTPDGAYGAPVQLAFLVKDNKIVCRLPELTVSSNIYDMFGKDFLGVCNDPFNKLSESPFTVLKMKVDKA